MPVDHGQLGLLKLGAVIVVITVISIGVLIFNLIF